MRQTVYADNVVATSQPLAAEAGLSMLARGGNAVDAAIAAAITLTVVEPTGNGIGSDVFALVWDGAALHGLNASGRAPSAWSVERFAGLPEMPREGWDAVTVPGAVSSWVALHERFAALDFESLFTPALRYAREGFLVSPWVAESWARGVARFAGRADFLAAFSRGGRAPRAGERFVPLDQAATLEDIARTRGASFYEGALAEALVQHAQREGGALRLEDLAAHAPEWVTPLRVRFRGHDVVELPPNGQGLAALVALGVLEHLDEPRVDPDDAAGAHLLVEAVKVGLADMEKHLADPAAMALDPARLLDPKYLVTMGESIDRERAWPPDAFPRTDGGTVLVVSADADGRMVALIQSSFMGFGSGVVVPGTGIALQNRGAGFSLDEGHPNVVAGGKRPAHTILPAMVMKDGAPRIAFGVMGGPMQPQGHVQVLARLLEQGLDPQQALSAPRWRVMGGRSLWLEPGFSPALLEGLRARQHEVRVQARHDVTFGGGQLIMRAPNGGYGAGSDERRDGQAVGF